MRSKRIDEIEADVRSICETKTRELGWEKDLSKRVAGRRQRRHRGKKRGVSIKDVRTCVSRITTDEQKT